MVSFELGKEIEEDCPTLVTRRKKTSFSLSWFVYLSLFLLVEGEDFVNSSWINYLGGDLDLEIGNLESALYQFRTIGRNDQGESPPSGITEARPIPGIVGKCYKYLVWDLGTGGMSEKSDTVPRGGVRGRGGGVKVNLRCWWSRNARIRNWD